MKKNATSGGTDEKIKISGLEEISKYFTEDKQGENFYIKYFSPIHSYNRGISYFNNSGPQIQTTSSVVNLNTSSINPSFAVSNNLYVTEAITRTEQSVFGLYLSKKIYGSFEETKNEFKKTIDKIELEFLMENGSKQLALIHLEEPEIEIINKND